MVAKVLIKFQDTKASSQSSSNTGKSEAENIELNKEIPKLRYILRKKKKKKWNKFLMSSD